MASRARLVAVAIGIGMAVTATGSVATAGSDSSGTTPNMLREQLTGYEEDPAPISTNGTGRFQAKIDDRLQQITYQLSYTSLEGTVQQAHIHFGGKAQSGGISVFLCTNLGNGPVGTQLCPAAPATVTGTIKAADVIGPANQSLTAGQYDDFVKAIRNGTTYVNVHSSSFPGGEIRAQLGHHH
ncbi:CHRD domain-containing protein [Kribbella orskensis]|uniref:CHRD domain-containing protein n=1 Tax=Kribbella orskensis TaxID=2512216 RepID=A0ABY2BLP7_9ACTN|nr:CHRD domain-containing protein [Kribbella sp. VKM Ac-2500]TCO24297.1 CHRD domain-containing protein [Kribbella orskensis]